MKIITIFGAGASFDSLGSFGETKGGDFKPPLTDGLFSVSGLTSPLIPRYPSLATLAQEIRAALAKGGTSLEEVLGDFWNLAKGKPHRQRQLQEAARYIAHCLKECSQNYISHGSNYEKYINLLLDKEIDCHMVTFNYDTLIEQALEKILGAQFYNMEKYHSSPIPLTKIHGSWNWHRDAEQKIHVEDRKKSTIDEDVCIGLPIVETKTIVCPSEHLKKLREDFPGVHTVVVIGWRGREPHFFEELQKEQDLSNKEIHLVAVNNSEAGCYELHRNFRPHFKTVILHPYIKGFKHFMDEGATRLFDDMLRLRREA